MIAATLFSGIGAPECSAPQIDWRWGAEIDPFASAVHAVRFPQMQNLGDVTEIDADAVEPVDLIVFGSPCQSFSVAGKRLGLDDPRGNLALIALRLVGRIKPRWLVFENVPGLLSSDGGRDFGAFLGLLGECGYGYAYRVLDAQHFGVPQRRRRLFVVGCLGDWRAAAAVLFEPESLRGDTAPRRETGERIARPIASCPEGGSGYRADADTADNLIAFSAADNGRDHGADIAPTLAVKAGRGHGSAPSIARSLNGHAGRIDGESETFIAGTLDSNYCKGPGARGGQERTVVTHSLRADGFDASEDGTGRGTPLTLASRGRGDSHDLEWRDDGTANAILTPNGGRAGIGVGAVAQPLRSNIYNSNPTTEAAMHIQDGMSVRRLTPTECEKLQGLPPNYTLVPYRGKPASDGPRYRALGNSMAVPVIGWILQRITDFDALEIAA